MLEPFMNKDEIEVGLDEAGRGPLFGRKESLLPELYGLPW